MSLELFVNRDYENDLVYLKDGKYYDAVTLQPYQIPEGSVLIKLLEWNQHDLDNFSSKPLYVLTHNKWIIFDVQPNGSLVTIAQSDILDNDESLVNATIFTLPDLSVPSTENEGLTELPKKDIPIEVYERFVFMINNGMSLNQYNEAVPEIGVHRENTPPPISGVPGSVGLSDRVSSGGYVNPVSIARSIETALSEPGSPTYDGSLGSYNEEHIPVNELKFEQMMLSPVASPVKSPGPIIQEDPLLKQSFDVLMKQVYNLPVEIPPFLVVDGSPIHFIDLNMARQLLDSGQIERYIFDPMLQPWAGHPFLSNRILTLFDKNGNSCLVRASYNPETRQLNQPVN